MRAAVLCTLLAVALAAALSDRAERAASIEYEFVARPAAVAADYDGPNARFLANNWEPEIKTMVLTGMFGNLPWKSRHILVQNEENWSALFGAAMKQLREGKAAEVMPVQMNWITGQKVPMSAQHFLTYRWENSSTADGTYWIRRVPYPILMVRDDGDAIVQGFEPPMLLSAPTSTGTARPSL